MHVSYMPTHATRLAVRASATHTLDLPIAIVIESKKRVGREGQPVQSNHPPTRLAMFFRAREEVV